MAQRERAWRETKWERGEGRGEKDWQTERGVRVGEEKDTERERGQQKERRGERGGRRETERPLPSLQKVSGRTYRARWLHPRFSINLHWEPLPSSAQQNNHSGVSSTHGNSLQYACTAHSSFNCTTLPSGAQQTQQTFVFVCCGHSHVYLHT